MNIMVTGGAGFLGSHLCEQLLAAGHHVLCVDDFSTGREENVITLRSNHRFQVLHHDICLPLNADVDAIYNLACPASPVHYQADPIQTMRTSVLGALNLLELARRRSIPILQTSTSEVYGDPAVHPQMESYWGNVNPIGLRACYDEGKRCAETMFFDYRRQHGVNTKVVRLFNTYGPHMRIDDGRVISNFIVQALQGIDLTVYGAGQQTRSFCYIDDVVEGLMRTMHTPEPISGPVNLGNPGEFTILELANKVLEITHSESKIVYKPLPSDDPRQRRPDIELAAKLLNGWKPRVELDEGLSRTIRYFQQALALS
ncbi:UDP-glucuronic acid decarboxylase family protein [Acidovorax delafieldii]|uniref:UDP-glucuronic acid decarboxylase family protein n=1 Tax=Acidovorax delafieldii TaxID=47920 RepID=UPI003ECE774A